MTGQPTIEVPLPHDVQPTTLDLELLKATFQAIVTLRYECSRNWEATLRQLEGDGWSVQWGLTWHAVARRGDDYEEASGKTLDETFVQLQQLARLDRAPHWP